MNFDIAEVLTRAGQITWKHKVLWAFSILPILINFLFIPIVFIPMFFIGPYSLGNQRFVDEPYYISLFISTNLFLVLISILLYGAGAAATSLGVLRVENGQERLPFRDLFQDGLVYFWRILGVSLLIGGGMLLVYFLLFGCMMLFGMATLGLGMICLQPLFLLMYPAMLLAYALVEESQAAVVADRLDVFQAIAKGWTLMRMHFWKFALITLIIYLGIFILGMIVSLPFMIPFFFLPLIMGNLQESFDFQKFGWVMMIISLVMLPFLALFQGVSMTFMKSAFMVIYLRLTRTPAMEMALQ